MTETQLKSFHNKNIILWRSGSRLLTIQTPAIMGILNLTSDSYFSESRIKSELHLLRTAEKMIHDGADMLDLGAASSRPGSVAPEANLEREKISNAVQTLKKQFPEVILSIDTFRSEVAKAAADCGSDIINDISAGSLDPKIIEIAASFKLPFIAMHMRGTPSDMQQHTNYQNLIQEISDYFIHKTLEFKQKGVVDIAIDPGFGFAKTLNQNYELLKKLPVLGALGYPVLVGISRKSMITKLLCIQTEDALPASSALHMVALQKGATILRVHDVKEAKQVASLYQML